MREKKKVVMLSSKEAKLNDLVIDNESKLMKITASDFVINYNQGNKSNGIAQHLYVIDNSEIKEGDWYIWTDNKQLCKAEGMLDTLNRHLQLKQVVRVIATTNSKLWHSASDIWGQGVDLIPNNFIQAYIRGYNAGTPITEIIVETEFSHIAGNYYEGEGEPVFRLKLRTDGTIIIHPVKERTYNEEDMKSFAKFVDNSFRPEAYKQLLENWLSENYPE